MTPSAYLRLTGEALYGPLWQSQLARDLGCNVRTIQRYAAGSHEPAPSILIDLRDMLADRRAYLDQLIEQLPPLA